MLVYMLNPGLLQRIYNISSNNFSSAKFWNPLNQPSTNQVYSHDHDNGKADETDDEADNDYCRQILLLGEPVPHLHRLISEPLIGVSRLVNTMLELWADNVGDYIPCIGRTFGWSEKIQAEWSGSNSF